MSALPAVMAGQAVAQLSAISPLDAFLQLFNNNPYFIGIMMLILNLGGRFIGLEVTKQQEIFLQHPWVRRILIFTVLFIATRNLWVAFWTTLAVILFLGYLFNENSSLCIFGKGGTTGSSCASSLSDEMTPEEREILQRLSAKAERYQANAAVKIKSRKTPQPIAAEHNIKISANQIAPIDSEEDVLLSDIYAANMSLLKR